MKRTLKEETMKKRCLAAVLALVLAAGLVIGPVGPVETVRADYTVEVPDPWIDGAGFKFHIRSDQQTDLSQYYVAGDEVPHFDSVIQGRISDGDGDWVFPVAYIEPRKEIKNELGMVIGTTHPVYHLTTKIYDEAFAGRRDVKKITVPSNVDTIGTGAFRYCSNLKEVVIHAGAFGITIEEGAFYGCNSLERVTITGSGNISINGWTTLDENVQDIKIEGGAFQRCDNLTSFAIVGNGNPRSIEIGDSAFGGCVSLTTVAFPDKVTSGSIGRYAFADCDNLTEITIPGGVTDIGYGAFLNDNLTEITISGGVTNIGDMAFWTCPLTDVTIPDGVKSIGGGAFAGSGTITNITIPDSVESIGDCAFSYNALTSIAIPKNVSHIGANPVAECEDLQEILLDEKNAHYTLEDGILYDKDKIRLISCLPDKTGNVTIPDSVTEIGDCAFACCRKLEEIIIQDSVERIGELAFHGCRRLTSIMIPEHVAEIGEIGDYGVGGTAFELCSDLLTITVDEKNETYSSEDGILYNKDKTRLIACPNGKTGDLAIPQTVTAISEHAFYGSKLTVIALPDTMESISSIFHWNDNLFGIIFPDSVTDIGEWIFDGCQNLTIYGNEGSYAETYALEHNIPFSTGTPPKGLASCEITVILPSLDDDKAEQPTVIVKDGNKTLESGTDYTVEFGWNYAYLEGKGEYVGYVTKYFELPEEPGPDPGTEISSEVRQKILQLVEECEASGAENDYEKALWLHDWLIYHADYDEEMTEYRPEGVLLNGKGVCQSYATAYQLLLDEMGIENDIVVAPEMDHAWNIAKINDSWTHIDCTWDDPIAGPCSDETGSVARGGMENHTYFGLGDEEMAKDHTWNRSAYPECFAILRELSKDSLKNPYDLMKPIVGYELSLADASGRTLTRKDFATGNTLLIFGRPTCPNTMWFINEITPWKDVLEQNQVHVVVVFENEQQVKESAGQIPFTCTYEKDIIETNWEFDKRCGLTDPYITFPRVVLQNAQGYAFYYSTGFVNEPERVLATALQKLPVTEDISKVIQQNNKTESPKVGESLVVNGTTYRITSSSKGKKEVSYIRGNKKSVKITIPAAITVKGISYKVTTIANNAFNGCKKLKSVTIGKNVTKIGDSAFFKCTSLKKITVPASVTKIGKKAFYGCKNLKSIIIKTPKLKSKSVGTQAFKGIHKKAVITVPKKQKKAYKKWLEKKGITKKMKIK